MQRPVRRSTWRAWSGSSASLQTLRGHQSLQFSFATKLAATVNPRLPIYDKEVASVFQFRAPYTYKPFERRLAEYLGFHECQKQLYEQIVNNGLLNAARAQFRKRFACSEEEVSEYKVIDFILWAAGKQSRDNP